MPASRQRQIWRLPRRRAAAAATLVSGFVVVAVCIMAAFRQIFGISLALTDTTVRSIPAVIHQMAAGPRRIPAAYTSHVTSWLSVHPDHAYKLWTDAALRRLIRIHFPESVNWTRSLLRSRLEFSDASRYFLLLAFGGIYADMDVRVRQPLPAYLTGLSKRAGGRCGCFIGQEPESHAVLLYGLARLPSNALMACLPGHEFMRFVLHRLPLYLGWMDSTGEEGLSQEERLRRRQGFHASRLTGPLMLHRLLRQYQRSPPCSLQSPNCRVCLMEPEYTMPYPDASQLDRMRSLCDTVAKQPVRVPLARRARVARFCSEHYSSDDEFSLQRQRKNSADASDASMVVAEHDFLHLAYAEQADTDQDSGNSSEVNLNRWLNLNQLMAKFPGRIDIHL